MNIEKTARAIIIIENNEKKYLVSIKRTKFKNSEIDNIYYTLPGGHIEYGESSEDTVIREIKEELDIEIKVEYMLADIFNVDLNRQEVFYICSKKSGSIKEGIGPEWQNPNFEKYGSYEIVYIPCDKLKNYNLLPLEIKEMLISKFN